VTATIGVGSSPEGVGVDPAAGTVYVANYDAGTMSVINAATNTVTATIPFGVDGFPFGVAVDPAAGTVYVTDSVDTVAVIDVKTDAVTATIGVASDPSTVAADPAAGIVYVASVDSDTVSVIDVATNTVTAAFGAGVEPYGVAADTSLHTAYLTGGDDVVVIGPGQAPAITSARSASIGMRSPADVTVTATGIPVPALTETSALPAGITFTDHGNGTATLSGTAPAGTTGHYPITITATNGIGSPATQAFTLTVTTKASAPAITSDPAAIATFGTPFSFTVTTNGSPVPSIAKTGTMPPGVQFTNNKDGTATISGTAVRTALGPYPVTLTAKNAAGTVTQSFTLTITKAPVLANIPATTATISTPMHLAMTATGYPTPGLAEYGKLAAGLGFTSTGNGQAAISRTPPAGTVGSYAITIRATNQSGTTSETFTLKVRS
jgi:YVTN family beta-propeller protein